MTASASETEDSPELPRVCEDCFLSYGDFCAVYSGNIQKIVSFAQKHGLLLSEKRYLYQILPLTEVLLCFKQLHRTRLEVFCGDEAALIAARQKINDEFNKNRNVANADAIEELVKLGMQVDEVLRKNVIQAVKTDDTTYRAHIRNETTLLENNLYVEMPNNLIGPFKKRTKCSNPEKES